MDQLEYAAGVPASLLIFGWRQLITAAIDPARDPMRSLIRRNQ
jgi:hypothetical protein